MDGRNGDRGTSNQAGDFAVTIRNSRDHADAFGDPYVSRVVVGGTIAETALPAGTLAAADSVDVGNFAPEESAIVLLDLLSAPSPAPTSLNTITRSGSATMIDLVGVSVGNLASKVAAQLLGARETAPSNTVPALTDAAGDLARTVAGVGPDLTFGTADDVDIDLVPDAYLPTGPHYGTQDAAAAVAFALSTGHRVLEARASVTPDTVEVGEPASFDATDSVIEPPDGNVTYRWDFGDGSDVGSGRTVSHAFATAGDFTVTLTVADPDTDESDTAQVSVTVTPDTALVERAHGTDRIATAVAASQRGWTSSPRALLATATNFPDALAAGALAGSLDAPLLLTDASTLSGAVEGELSRLAVKTVTILGGPSAVSEAVSSSLVDLGYTVERIEGPDRFATAAAVAKRVGASPAKAVTIALGQHADLTRQSWPDALSAGALSATPARIPTLLTRSDQLPQATRAALSELAPETVYVLGGEAAVSEQVADQLSESGYVVERLEGDNRFETSVAVATKALEHLPDWTLEVVFATGFNYPDGLAAGALAARRGALVMLVPRDALDQAEAVRDFLADNANRLDLGTVVGGEAAVSDAVRAGLEQAMAAT